MNTELNNRHEQNVQVASQAISTLCGYEKAQHTENLVQRWSQFGAYMPLAVYHDELAQEALEQVKVLLGQILPDSPSQQQACDLLAAAVISDLAGNNSDDAKIAAGIARVKRSFSRMDWWSVQNAIWADGKVNPKFLAVAKELGFRI